MPRRPTSGLKSSASPTPPTSACGARQSGASPQAALLATLREIQWIVCCRLLKLPLCPWRLRLVGGSLCASVNVAALTAHRVLPPRLMHRPLRRRARAQQPNCKTKKMAAVSASALAKIAESASLPSPRVAWLGQVIAHPPEQRGAVSRRSVAMRTLTIILFWLEGDDPSLFPLMPQCQWHWARLPRLWDSRPALPKTAKGASFAQAFLLQRHPPQRTPPLQPLRRGL